MANKKEFLIDNLVESGFLFKEEDSDFVIMEQPIEGFSYLKRRIAVSSDGKIIYLGVSTDNNYLGCLGISTTLELEKIFSTIVKDEQFVNNLRSQSEAL